MPHKKLRQSATIWFALLITPIAWFSIWWNGWIMPIELQWIGPPLLAIGIILLRLKTDQPVCEYRTTRIVTHRNGKDVRDGAQNQPQQA